MKSQFLCRWSRALQSTLVLAALASLTAAQTPASTTPTAFLTGANPGAIRNNFTGFVGMQFTTGADALTVSALGRLFAAGDTAAHTVKLVQASTGADVPGTTVSISMASGVSGRFTYASLTTPVTLPANTSYFLVSLETSGQDKWFDFGPVTANSVAVVNGPAYWDGSRWVLVSTLPSWAYGPVDFQYTKASSPVAPTVSITVPVAGAVVSTGSLSVSVSTTGTVNGIQLLVDGTNSGSVLSPSSFPALLDTSALSNGSHTLAAVAKDTSGQTASSTTVTFTVSNPAQTAPVVTVPAVPSAVLTCSQFGAVGDGQTDDTAAIQAALNATLASSNSYGKTIQCGPGTYKITNTIFIKNARQFILTGSGAQTQFAWAGASSKVPMFDIHARDFTLENFRIVAGSAAKMQEAIRLENMGSGYIDPGHGTLRSLVIECTDGGCAVPVRLPIGAGGDNNNDLYHFIDNVFSNYSACGVSIEGTQEHNIRFDNNEFFANGIGQYGICGKLDGSGGAVANFDWEGGYLGSHTGADFYLGSPQVLPYIIRGISSEGSCKLIKTDGPTGYGTPILIEGVRWSDNAACAVGDIIAINWPGPIKITSSTLGLDYTKSKSIRWNYFSASDAFFYIEGTIMRGTSADASVVFTSNQPTRTMGFSLQTSDLAHKTLNINNAIDTPANATR